MACNLIGSIQRACADGMGGVKEAKWKIHPGLASISANVTNTSGVITVTSALNTGWYTLYQEKENASFTDNLTKNDQNSTVFSDQEVKLIFNKLTSSLRNELALAAAQNPLLVAIRDANDTYWLFGVERGMSIVTATANSGTASGDRNGYEVTLKGMESVTYHLPNISAATYNAFVS